MVALSDDVIRDLPIELARVIAAVTEPVLITKTAEDEGAAIVFAFGVLFRKTNSLSVLPNDEEVIGNTLTFDTAHYKSRVEPR